VRRLRTLSEDECYARCYRGWEPTVTVVRVARRSRLQATVSGEELRRRLEQRIDARAADEAA
jgi:hypothetical protein